MSRTSGRLLKDAAVSAPFDGAWVQVTAPTEQILLQIGITGTATVVVEGRMASDQPSVQITSQTASYSGLVSKFRQIRARVTTATTSPSVVVDIDAQTFTI